MKKEIISFEWVVHGVHHLKEINRDDMYHTFDDIRKRFQDNNVISTKLCELIPDIDSIIINWDRNEEKEIPFIVYGKDGEMTSLSIMRCHKHVWQMLKSYCTDF